MGYGLKNKKESPGLGDSPWTLHLLRELDALESELRGVEVVHASLEAHDRRADRHRAGNHEDSSGDSDVPNTGHLGRRGHLDGGRLGLGHSKTPS